MKKVVVKILSAIVVMAVCIGCGGGNDRMRMTVEGSGEVSIILTGSGTVTIDWGDGSDRTTRELDREGWFSKTYAGLGRHTITITGNDITGLGWGIDTRGSRMQGGATLTSLDVRRNPKLMRLDVRNTQLASLDLSRNTALTVLNVENNQLTSLDLSRNTKLFELWVNRNQLTTSALNALLESLPQAHRRSYVFIGNNPGTSEANRNIATTKGWRVY